jgi:hypothetical protein
MSSSGKTPGSEPGDVGPIPTFAFTGSEPNGIGACLENRCGIKPVGGSRPPTSATCLGRPKASRDFEVVVLGGSNPLLDTTWPNGPKVRHEHDTLETVVRFHVRLLPEGVTEAHYLGKVAAWVRLPVGDLDDWVG